MRDRLVSARTIAILCGGLPIDQATDLIEQYADMKASEATLASATDLTNKMLRIMGSAEVLIAPGL